MSSVPLSEALAAYAFPLTPLSNAPAPMSSDASPDAQVPATSATTAEVPAFGWSGYAERVNGRFAMVGFIAVLLIEALSGETFLRWAGLVP